MLVAWGRAGSSPGTCSWDSSCCAVHVGSSRQRVVNSQTQEFLVSPTTMTKVWRELKANNMSQVSWVWCVTGSVKEISKCMRACAVAVGKSHLLIFIIAVWKSFWISHTSFCKGQMLNDLNLKSHMYFLKNTCFIAANE